MFASSTENAGFSAVGQDELEQVNGGDIGATLATVLPLAGTGAAIVGGAMIIHFTVQGILGRVRSGSK